MSTLSIVPVFDKRDGKHKMLTKIRDNEKIYKRPASQTNDNPIKTSNIEVTITNADDPILPMINKRGNIILELTEDQFFDLRDRLQY